jgi:hypothetical protein
MTLRLSRGTLHYFNFPNKNSMRHKKNNDSGKSELYHGNDSEIGSVQAFFKSFEIVCIKKTDY